MKTDDAARLLLRLALGGLMLFHGVDKVLGGVDGLAGLVTGAGLPRWFVYGVYVGEVLAPLMLILGVYSRIAALVIAVNMVAAVALAHMSDLGSLGPSGGWALELQAFYLFVALAIVLLGSGRFALRRD